MYRVTFVGDWTATNHPIDYPNNAHFSNLIGSTHNQVGGTWALGELASSGIKSMAEDGLNNLLITEVNAQMSAGTAENLIEAIGGYGDETTFVDFEITASHPRVSLTSMIAPSPDWFVGVHDLSLINSGEWLEELMIELLPYDAGTDSGASFRSENFPTQPAQPISLITTHPLPDNVPLGYLVFTRLSTTGSPPDEVFVSNFEAIE